jgi:pimeloyl-ACP methyl ester carboxylesterase
LKFHKAWVEKIPGGQLIITENSGHGIPFEEPELVINTIREAVNRARLPNVSREIDVHGH